MKEIILLACFVFLSSTTANAGIYLEPYLGYEMGKSSGSLEFLGFGTESVDQTSKGAVFGGKVGYSLLGLAAGFDYSNFKSKDTDKTGGGADGDSTVVDMGGFVQYTFPILFKVSATYVFKSNSKADSDESEGKGFKVGVGYTGLPFVSINVDYISLKYDSVTSPGFTVENADVKSTATMLSISLPLDF